MDEDTPDSRGAGFLAGLQPSGTGLAEGWASFLVHCCHSGASDQRPGPELSDRKGCSSHFFLSSLSAQDWFQKGSVKTIVTKRRIPFLFLGQTKQEGGEWRTLVSHPRLNIVGTSAGLVWGRSKLGHCPPEEPSLLTPDDGELPPRGLTPNSEQDHFHVVFLSLAISILRLSPSFISIYVVVYTTLYLNVVCADPCALGFVVSKGKGISLPSEYVLQIDEHLQIALRCVNLRCEIIDRVRRLSHISGIDGFLSRLACDLGR